jgi:hypothetical protein
VFRTSAESRNAQLQPRSNSGLRHDAGSRPWGKRYTLYDRLNTVSLSAGDEGGALAVVFHGVIKEAWADLQGAPEVFFEIQAHTGTIEKMKPVPAISYKGAVDAATIIEALAKQMGYGFENSGASYILTDPIIPARPWNRPRLGPSRRVLGSWRTTPLSRSGLRTGRARGRSL